jgi:hypothetical protein
MQWRTISRFSRAVCAYFTLDGSHVPEWSAYAPRLSVIADMLALQPSADIVAKLFSASERERLIQDQL